IRSALIAGHRDRVLPDRRRNEHSSERPLPIARLRDTLFHRLVLFGGREPRIDIIDRERLTHERRRLRRERLRGPGLLARHVALRHRPLFDRPQRLAGPPTGGVHKTTTSRVWE